MKNSDHREDLKKALADARRYREAGDMLEAFDSLSDMFYYLYKLEEDYERFEAEAHDFWAREGS